MKKFNKKRKNRVTKIRKTWNNAPYSQDSAENYKDLEQSNSPHNNNSIDCEEQTNG